MTTPGLQYSVPQGYNSVNDERDRMWMKTAGSEYKSHFSQTLRFSLQPCSYSFEVAYL